MSQQTTRRILSLHLPYLPTDRIARNKWGVSWRSTGIPADAPPLAVTARIKNAQRLAALDERAHAHGLTPGQSLSDARALAPSLEVAAENPAADEALLTTIAAWCDRYTPLIAPDLTGGLFLDITGCTHLFGGERALRDDLTRRLARQGLAARTAIADTPGAAWALSHHARQKTIAAPGKQHDAIAPLPLAALRIDAETVDGLARMGLRTVACIARLPRAPLTARFGPGLLTRLDQALGRLDETISPLLPVPELSSEKRFAEPIALQDDIERTITSLAGNLAPLLERRGLGARTLVLKLFRVDGARSHLQVRTAAPLRDPTRITALFRERLAALASDFDAGFGFDITRLDVTRAEPLAATQADLIDGAAPDDAVTALIDRLGARLGTDRIRAFAYNDSHIPELSFTTLPASSHIRNTPADLFAVHAPDEDTPPTRPLLLLATPEPVEAVAEVPLGPPVRFRWRKAAYRVARAEGPERIACEWWRSGKRALTRDYFRIEDTAGYRFWLFRHGLYERETADPRWYLHGIFA